MEQSAIQKHSRHHDSVEIGYDTLTKVTADGNISLDVLVSGVHCAGCIQKIESGLMSQSHMISARLNFTTRRLHMVWTGDNTPANDFVRKIEKLGYGVTPYDPRTEREGTKEEDRFLLLCLGVAGFSMGNIMLLSVGLWSSSPETMGIATRDLLHWISALIALPTILFSGRPFFRSAYKALSNGHTNMDVPISLAISLAGIMSLYETLRHGEHAYFDSAVMLMFFLLIGRYLDFRARSNARSAATDLLSTLSGFAQVIEGNKTRSVAIRDLNEGMIVRVAVGDKFPIDGKIIEGETEVDTALVTGETLPRPAKIGDDVYAGTINIQAPVLVCVAKAAENSLLSDIVRLMEKAEQGQAKYVRLADRMAKMYTPVVHALAATGFLWWFAVMGAPWQDALMIAVTILIITCPCALGLAVPIVQVLATGKLMKSGVLVKSGDALERLAIIDTIFFDKTGTLTRGHPTLKPYSDHHALGLAASLAQHSRHPLSRALVSAFAEEDFLEITHVQERAGKGLEGVYKGKTIRLGNRAWCGVSSDISQTDNPELWFVTGENSAPAHFTFDDPPRADAKETLQGLAHKKLGLTLVSGDRLSAAQSIGYMLGISDIHAPKTPPEKYALMEEYKAHGRKILMVGDGLNDAPVLAGAHVSMAPGSAVDMAQNAADIVFMGDSLAPVLKTYIVATFSQRLVKENFALAIAYNFIAVPLAFMGMVTPMVAAIAMSGSSLLVIANSFRLRMLP